MTKTFKILMIVLVGSVVAGCQTAQDRFGKGPLTITKSVQNGFEKYKGVPGGSYFAISLDGRRYGYSYCAAGPDACHSSPGSLAVNVCQRGSSSPCKVYARGHFVVWDGAVTVGVPSASQGASPSAKSDDVVCGYAVDYSGDEAKWHTSAEFAGFVEEAQRRGFTVEKCDAIF